MRSIRLLRWTLPILLMALLTACGSFTRPEGSPSRAALQRVETLQPLTPAPSAETGAMNDETPTLWFVELASPPLADGGVKATVDKEQKEFRNAAAKAGLKLQERYAYQTLFNGLSVRVGRGGLAALTRIPGVKAVYPVVPLRVPDTKPTLEPELATALAMTGADVAQNELGLSGHGVRVAVMDTGVDYDHPDLGGCFGPGCRVAVGYDFVGDNYNADPSSPSYSPVPVPDPDPDDCHGHGTHVAGIVGADGQAKGVAPGVTFGAYRVFGCDGSTESDIMLAAMERLLADGMQVLNMSIGAAFQAWPQYPTARASDRLVNRGVVVVASIGNSGANGLYAAGAPGVGTKVIGVASFDNSHVQLNTFTVSPDDAAIGYANASGTPEAPTSGSASMARTGTTSSTADACNPLPAGSLSGQVALIRRGSCTFYLKATHAQNAGAIGVVIYNNVPGRFSASVIGSPAVTIPVVTVSDSEGILIDGRLAGGPVTMTWTDAQGTFVNPTGGLVSSFSSYGLTAELDLKPDLGAPGGLIRSTYPLEKGGYATLSGTSMASPHVAGAVALLLEARPRTPAQAVRGLLQASADPKVWWGNPGLGFLDNVHRQGAGMLDVVGAVETRAKVEPAKLALGESQGGSALRTLRVENDNPYAVTYTLSHQPALATGPSTFTPSFLTGFASVAFGAPSVVVPAGGSSSVDVTLTANPGLPDGSLYGGYLTLSGSDGSTLRVPYAGFKGDYQAISVLTPTPFALPWLAQIENGAFVNRSGGGSYTLVGDDLPFLLVHLDHPARRLRLEAFDADTGKAWHRVFDEQYLGRNSTSTSFFALPWDGTTTNGNKVNTVPNGRYVIRLSVLKALGQDGVASDWETWTSPVITLARP